jgi:cbb3-type cytochrome oxidase subunit 3
MENSEIMKRLMQDGSNPESQQKSTPTNKGAKKDSDLALSKIRVVTAKYKVLMVLCLIFVCILWFNFIPDTQNSYDSSLKNYEAEELKMSSISKKIVESNNDIKFLNEIIHNEHNLAECLNKDSENNDSEDSSLCSNLPEGWKI